ncbi:MAG: hypothetical protein HC888_00225 [Candidatus Competibacteraceae bacterium]|nr:hypothetical protein [Candidatus Competibacteraceae bacterium]
MEAEEGVEGEEQKLMKREVRGLLAKLYTCDEQGCVMQVTTSDDAINIMMVDVEADIYYRWNLTTDGKVKSLNIDSVTQIMLDDQNPL